MDTKGHKGPPPALGNTSASAEHQPAHAPRKAVYLTTGKTDDFGPRGRFITKDDGYEAEALEKGLRSGALAEPTERQLRLRRI